MVCNIIVSKYIYKEVDIQFSILENTTSIKYLALNQYKIMDSIFMKYAKASNAGTKGYPSTYVLDSFPIFIITKNEIAQYERSCKRSTFDYLVR